MLSLHTRPRLPPHLLHHLPSAPHPRHTSRLRACVPSGSRVPDLGNVQVEHRRSFAAIVSGVNIPPGPLDALKRVGIPDEDFLGPYEGYPGHKIGPNERFELRQRLSKQRGSITWLAKNTTFDQFVAVKILDENLTKSNTNQIHQELDVYKALADGAQDHNCSTLIDYFDVSDAVNKDGPHLCLVTDLLRCTAFDIARELRRSGQSFSLSVVKLILRDILKAVSFLHSHGVAHTSISPKAVGIVVDSDLDIDNWLKPNPEAGWSAWQNRQLPLPSLEALDKKRFILTRFDNAQFLNSKKLDLFEASLLTVQPLETRLCLDWNQKVDIWGIGLLAYYLLTLKPLFSEHGPPGFFDAVWMNPHLSVLDGFKRYPGQDTGAYTDFLTLLYCDDTLPQAMIEACERIIEFYGNDLALFPESTVLKRILDSPGILQGKQGSKLEIVLDCFGLTPMNDEERWRAAKFWTRCLELVPKKRATAEELLNDPWLQQSDNSDAK